MAAKIISNPAKTSHMPQESAGKLLFDRLSTYDKNAVALVEVQSGLQCTYGDLVTHSVNLASNLRTQLKIAKNDNLAIVSENSPKFLVAVLAALYLAAPVHLINPGYTIYELKKSLMMSKPKLVYCSKKSFAKLEPLKKECDIQFIVLFDLDDSQNVFFYKNLIQDSSLVFEFEKIDDLQEQVAYIANSSGTTGLPKGVMITHENFRLNLSHQDDNEVYPSDSNTVVMHVLPFYHVYGCGVTCGGFYEGVKVVVMEHFVPKIFLESIQKHKVTTMFVVPTLGDFLAHSSLVDQYDLSSVDEIYIGAGVVRKELQDKILQRFNHKALRQAYGLTEMAAAIFMTPVGSMKPGSCGRVTPGHQVKIVDLQTGELLGCNQPGEILVKGSSAMKGYINDPEKTRQAFDSDGFVRTADFGYYDEDHFFYIIDRLKDIIKYKSLQVSPVEIEEILLQHPGIKDAAVVGKPDDRYGELPVAFVVRKEGVGIEEDEVVDHVARFVCEEKRLHGGVRFVGEIPTNATGKVLRKELRRML